MRKRRGFTMVETMVTVILFGFLAIGFTQLALVQNSGEVSVDVQYSMLAADAYFADVYTGYRNAASFDLVESPAGIVSLTLIDSEGTPTIYSYNPTTKSCTINGVHQFYAYRYEVLCSDTNLLLSAKIEGERLMEISVYR